MDRSHPLQVFGSEVRRYREQADLSQNELAGKIPISSSHIGKIERGETRCRRYLAESMDTLLNTAGSLPALWDKLVKNAVFPDWFDWRAVEANPETLSLEDFESIVVPGLLQSEEYARSILENDDKVAGRMERQDILTRGDPLPPRLSVLLTENVLTNMVGNKEIMRGQLQKLLDVSSSRITIQIVPEPIPSSGTSGAFCLATLADRSELGYVETPARGFTLSEPADIQTLSNNMADIRARALPINLSRDHIHRVMEERWT